MRPHLPVISLLLLLVSCKDEREYCIKARITGIPDGTKMMLQNVSTGIFLDSAIISNSEFSFKGHLAEVPEELRIISGLEELKKGNLYYTDLLMGNENVYVEADVSDLPYNVTTRGSSIQKEAEVYRKGLYKWNIKIDSLRAILNTLPDSVGDSGGVHTVQKIDEVTSDFNKWQVKYLKENFNSYIALLMYNYRRDFPVEILDSLYSQLSPNLKESKYGKAIQMQIQFPPPGVGEIYHDFQSIDFQGDQVNLSDIEDRYILLQFAGTGCFASDLAIKNMKEIYKTYLESVVFVSTFFEPKPDFKKYVFNNEIPWITTWFPNGKYGEPANKYGIVGTPTFYLISPEKKIVSKWLGFEDGTIENEIEKILGH